MSTPKADPDRLRGASLDAGVQGTLGRRLRESYDEVVKEDIPTKFLELLRELKSKDPGDGNSGA